MAAFTDDEYAAVARALCWAPGRTFRLPVALPWGFGPRFAHGLDAKLAELPDGSKALALALAQEIVSRQQEARDETFDGLPDVTQAGEIKKDARFGYEVRQRVLADMRAELAQIVDYAVNPAAVSRAGNPMVVG
ncbi:MAG TPA: hypothetical protein VFS43_38350 [Polyangiaceae bacterium]|nr:hypothetical protein [Polyangiaceae bacterium]